MPSQITDVAAGEPTSTQQLGCGGLKAMSNQLDVVQQREGGPNRGPVNELRLTTSSDDHRRFGRYRLGGEPGPPQPPRHLPRNDHRLRIQGPQQLVTEQPLDRRAGRCHGHGAVGVAYGAGRRPEESFEYGARLWATRLQCRIDLFIRHRAGRRRSQAAGIRLERLANRPYQVQLIVLAPQQGALSKLLTAAATWVFGCPSMAARSLTEAGSGSAAKASVTTRSQLLSSSIARVIEAEVVDRLAS